MGTRTERMTVRLSRSERARVEAKASVWGLPPSTFMRRSALLRDTEPARVADAGELRAIRAELKRIGTNLNQAARALNARGGPSPAPPSLEPALREVSRAARGISEMLAEARDPRRRDARSQTTGRD